MPTVYIIAGPNGAGKTTFARRFLNAEAPGVEFINADSIAQGLAPYAPETAAIAAGRLMITRLRELSARRESFAFETTLSGRAYVPFLKDLRAAGYRIELDFLWLPFPEQSITRVAKRVTQGGHHIPTDVIHRRHSKGLRNLFEIYRHLLDRLTIFDNTVSPTREIAIEEGGSLMVLDFKAFAVIEQIVQGGFDE